MQIFSFSPFGYEGSLVAVEVDLRRGIPSIDMVGLADGAVKESRERMRSAIRNSGFDFPLERVLISLSPADLKKEGAGFDLAIALAVLKEQEETTIQEPILVMGELELSGRLRPVRGVHAAVSTAAASGIGLCIVPKANGGEALEVSGIKVFAAENLFDAFHSLSSLEVFSSSNKSHANSDCMVEGAENVDGLLFPRIDSGFEFENIHGQEKLIRSLQIAASGAHNLLAFGPPGCGKTLALQKFPALLPFLSIEDAQSVTRIYSLAGLLPQNEPFIRTVPFRMPHQSASLEGICGGGPYCRPGEISLAHNGVLFLDEAPEFRSSVLQMLRVPLESGKVTLSRAGRTTVYPASFQLMMAANPCPCGNFGSANKICLCSARSVEMYWKKFSGPLLDRIDLRIRVEIPDESKNRLPLIAFSKELSNKPKTTSELRRDIARAVLIQRKRQGCKNAKLLPQDILGICKLSLEAQKILEKESSRNDFSPRATSSCLKIARTIADMEGSEIILDNHITEAISFRKVSGGLL